MTISESLLVQIEGLKTYIDTVVSGLRTWIEARFDGYDERFKSISQQFEADHRATELAYKNMERRLDGMNEFRAALDESTENNVTKGEFNQFVDRTNSDLRSLRESRAEIGGKATQEALNRTTIIAVVGIGLSIMGTCIGATGLVMGILTFGMKILGGE